MIKTLVIACVLAFGAGPLRAQDGYPNRAVTLIYPYAAGGSGDIVARTFADLMGKRLGQSVIVENRSGGSGIIGTNLGAKAPADGYTVLLTTTQAILNNRFLFTRLPYEPTRDLSFITEVCAASFLLMTNRSVPAQNVNEMLDWARTDKVNFGSWGTGSSGHLAGAYLAKLKNLDFVHVAYKGEAPMAQDLASGQIQLAIGTLPVARPFIHSGKVRVLAVLGDRRLPSLPDIPTFAEAGLPQPELRPAGFYVLMVPSATPAPIKARLETVAREAVATEEFRARMATLGLTPVGNSGMQARENYDALYPLQRQLVEVSGAKLD